MMPIIVQGGMGIGVSLSRLAGAVAAEGGVGVVSAAVPGFNRSEFPSSCRRANLEALAYHIKAAKSTAVKAATGGKIGVNIMCALSNYADYVKCSLENGADLIISGAGLPTELPALVSGYAKKIAIAPIVSSRKAVAVLFKLWAKKFSRTADMLVIEGPKAGGHLGFSPAQLEKSDLDYDAEVSAILQEVALYEEQFSCKIPVIFAGGVHTREDIAHYTALGCAGVQIASRFVATEECDAHEKYKQAYVEASSTVIIKSPVGMPGRAIENEFVRRLNGTQTPVKSCTRCITHCNPAETPYCISRALINAVNGDVDNGLIFCGANVAKINEISTVKKVMGELQA